MQAEAIVVGSGPAGAAAASALVRAGVDVLMLEAGAPPEEDRFAVMQRAVTGQIPWEFPPIPYEMHGDGMELNRFAIRRVGGSSLAWGAITPRFLASDFQLRSRYGVAADWPLSYDDLEPYYCKAERFMGVAGDHDNPFAGPRSEPFPMPPFPMSDSDLFVKDACRKLGIALHSVPVARNSVRYDGRSVCTYYGACRACPIGAMFSSDHVVSRLLAGPRFRLLTEADVQRVEIDSAGRAERVIYSDRDGRTHAAAAKRIVLAVQCIETVRILLNSATRRFPRGLANRNGQLGRRFMEHPKFYMMARVGRRLHPYRQGFETAATCQFHDHPRRGELCGGRLLVRENAGPSPAAIAGSSGLWGEALRREVRDIFGRFVTLGAFMEQLPRDENRVGLSAHLRHPDGTPAARVDFKLLEDYERAGIAEMRGHMLRIFDALGAEEIVGVMAPSNSGHYMGGHTMGLDPGTSVCNPDLETHEVPNLYLASGGVFPTSGVSNPTLTTVALVLRMVERMLS